MKNILNPTYASALLLLATTSMEARAATPKLRVTASINRTQLISGEQYQEAILVKVTDNEGAPVADVKAMLKIHTGPGKLYTIDQSSGARAIEAKTNSKGKVEASIDLRDVELPLEKDILIIDIEVSKDGFDSNSEVLSARLSPGFEGTFLSDRVASEIFLGTTFSQAFGDDGKNEGFSETALLARLGIDTLWGYQKNWKLHTALELMFSEFPSEIRAEQDEPSGPTTFVDFADSFSGSLAIYFRPKGWGFYSPTSRSKEFTHDAFSWSLMTRVGILTRDVKTASGDSALGFQQIGFAFAHRQVNAANAKEDRKNTFPLRFAELKFGHYDEFANKVDANRFVFDGGLRLANLAKGAMPFYAGIHVNAGKGEDDIRVFAGFLFELDKLAAIFAR